MLVEATNYSGIPVILDCSPICQLSSVHALLIQGQLVRTIDDLCSSKINET